MPYYWAQYGPTNFLWFCDVALLIGVAALWLESSLWASTQAVSIVLPQMVWVADFLARLAGVRLLDLTDYMFDAKIPLFVRGLSLFHGWLPFLLLWLVWRLGYDRRAWWVQSLLAWAVLAATFFIVKDPFGPTGNVNKIFGPREDAPQTWMRPELWLALLMIAHPVCIYVPTHLLFCRVFRKPHKFSDLKKAGSD